jgi:hypothetical protein
MRVLSQDLVEKREFKKHPGYFLTKIILYEFLNKTVVIMMEINFWHPDGRLGSRRR